MSCGAWLIDLTCHMFSLDINMIVGTVATNRHMCLFEKRLRGNK
jgi:hypothetical protein